MSKFTKKFKEGFNEIKKSSGDSFNKAEKSTEKEISELKEDFKDLRDRFEIKFDLLKNLSETQIKSVKNEAHDLKKILQSKEIIIHKSDSLALVLRKLGGLEDFIEVADSLAKEGYMLVLKEEIRDIPIPAVGMKFPLGVIYYFQRVKFLTRL